MTPDQLYNIAMDVKRKKLEHILWSQRELDEWFDAMVLPKLKHAAELGQTYIRITELLEGELEEVKQQIAEYISGKRFGFKINHLEDGTDYLISFGL